MVKFLFLAKRAAWSVLALAVLAAVSGCLYPKDQTPGRDPTIKGAVLSVQDAVSRYKEATGLLPMINADAGVPVYEKFKVDFAKLKRMGYVPSIPEIAFENGGSYVFLIIDEETDPQVKLLDIAVFQGIADVQKKVDEYRTAHGGANPAGTEVYAGYSYVDFGKLGISRPDLKSMFSQNPLELLVDGKGRVYGDYGIDIASAAAKSETAPGAGEDLRHRLTEVSYFVPVKSPVYKWVNGAPQAVSE